MSTNPLMIALDFAKPVTNAIQRYRWAVAIGSASLAVASALRIYRKPLADPGEPQDVLAAREGSGETSMAKSEANKNSNLAPGYYTVESAKDVSAIARRHLAKVGRENNGQAKHKANGGGPAIITKTVPKRRRLAVSDRELEGARLLPVPDDGIRFRQG